MEKLEAPLSHLIRNAVDHGLEMPDRRRAAEKPVAGTVTVEARHRAGMLLVSVSDDGTVTLEAGGTFTTPATCSRELLFAAPADFLASLLP